MENKYSSGFISYLTGDLNKLSNTYDIGNTDKRLMMTLSPKKYVTNFTSCTTNRGVEAKEKDITNTGLGRQMKISLTVPP